MIDMDRERAWLRNVSAASPRVSSRLCAALAVGLACATPAVAQQIPNAGRLLQESTPAPARPPSAVPRPERKPSDAVAPADSPAAAVRFHLNGLRFSGNTVFSSDELAGLFGDTVGRDVSLGELEQAVERVAKRYRERGYFLAQALIPRQEVTGGVVEVSVIEGRLGKLRIERAEGVRIPESMIRRYLGALPVGEPLSEQSLERTMLLLSDLPGVTFQSTLQEGEEAGTVDLLLEVGTGRRFAAQLEVDNYGLESSGEARLGGGFRVANPFGRGDNLDVRALITSATRTLFGRASYELPVGANGTRLGMGLSSLGYALGAPFNELGAEGYARVLDGSVQHPFLRSRTTTLLGSLLIQRKWVEDRYEAVDYSAKRDILGVLGGLTVDHRDQFLGGGYSNAGVTLMLGSLDIASGLARDVDLGAGGRGTDGSFAKLNYSVTRLQALAGKFNLFGGLIGQFASKNLDNAERFGLGGPRGVRAYSSGALVADEGVIATAELRYSVTPELTLSGFYDAGWGRINRDPIDLVVDNRQTIRGYGLGLFWGKARSFQLQASLAWRDTPPVPGDTTDRSPRLYVQGVKFF